MNYSPKLTLNLDPPDVSSQATKIIGVSHQHPDGHCIFNVISFIFHLSH
jgi:hypothetical protein